MQSRIIASLSLALVVALAGCYSPNFKEGLACSETGQCPKGQMCFSDGRCYSEDPGDGGPSVTTLASLELSDGTLEPAFDPAITDYTVDLGLRPADLGITATPLATAGIELAIAGASATPGVSAAVPLLFGAQAVEITVTNVEDESTTYRVTADRGAAMAYRAYIKASNAEAGDLFGMAKPGDNRFRNVAISGDTIAVGAPGEAGGLGGINVDEGSNSEPGAGAVYVFVRGSDGSWSQEAYIKPEPVDADDGFGTTVDLDGDTLVVGAPGEDSNETGTFGMGFNNAAESAGAAYVFVRTGTEWVQQAYLKASNTDAGDEFGSSVAVSGNTVAVGALREASSGTGVNQPVEANNSAVNAGAVYVFVRNGAWSQQAYVKASNTDPQDRFHQVSLAADTLVVGAPDEGSATAGVNGDESNNAAPGAGAAYMFERSGTTWTQTNYFKASNPTAGGIGTFATQLALSDDLLVAGRPLEVSGSAGIDGDQFDTGLEEHVGSAYAFRRNQSVWAQEAYIKPSNSASGASQAYFGNQIGISKSLVAIAAPLERSDSTGINGDQNNQRLSRAGAVYLFQHVGDSWSQVAYIKAPNSDSQDSAANTGVALDQSGTLVFASGDDSSSTGIDGDQADNSAIDSGALFVIE